MLYCTKKQTKTNVSRPLAKDQPGSDQLSRPQDQETYAFLVQYITFDQNIDFFSTVQQKCRFELQKPIKPYGFIGSSRRQINFIGTVQQKWSCELQKPIKPYGFSCVWSTNLIVCCTVPKKQIISTKSDVLYQTKKKQCF